MLYPDIYYIGLHINIMRKERGPMQKIARMQAQSHAIACGEDAAMGTVETVLLLIATVAVAALLFVFLTGKIKAPVDGVEKDIEAAGGYAKGTEIPAKAAG